MSWGSADLVPTARPLRSERALGSVVPFCPVLLPDSESHYHPRFTESRGDAELGGEQAAGLNLPSNNMRSHPIYVPIRSSSPIPIELARTKV
jgi:hypothetical protein